MKLRADSLALRQVGDDVMLLDLVSSQYFAVGGAGRVILDLLARADVSEAEIVREVTGTFSVDEQRAGADVAAFLAQLSRAGLLDGEVGPAAASAQPTAGTAAEPE